MADARRWSQEVTRTSNALDLEPGVFTWLEPAAIARSLKESAERSTRRRADPFRSAMSMLNLYINRAGTQLDPTQRNSAQNMVTERGILRRLADCYTLGQIATVRIPNMPNPSTSLMVRLDVASKDSIARAAELRHISVSDYVRTVVVAQAERDLRAAEQRVIVLTPDEQLAFWQALNDPPRLTAAQRDLGIMMRGE